MMAAAAPMITSGLYVLVVYRTGVFTFTEGFLLRIPFLFIVGLFWLPGLPPKTRERRTRTRG